MSSKIKTKYGNASLNWNGHYKITSAKEGNAGKFLHRVIYENYYNVTIMDWAVVHHLDKNPMNNNIENLKLMSKSEHSKMHHKSISKPHHNYKDKTGIYRLFTQTKRFPIKTVFAYRYFDGNGKYRSITSIDLNVLYNKVISKGLDWRINDYDKAFDFCKSNGYILRGVVPVKIV